MEKKIEEIVDKKCFERKKITLRKRKKRRRKIIAQNIMNILYMI